MKILTPSQELVLTRQASAERFPHPVPPGMPARRSNLSNPAASLPDLWAFYSVPEVRAICDRVAGGVGRVNFMPCVNLEGSTGDNCPPVIGAEGEIAEGVNPRLAADCAEIWAQVRSPSGPQSDIFTSIATALMVSGDAWQFGYPGTPEMRWNPEGTPMWVGVSRQSITERDGQYVVAVGIDGEVRVPSSPEVDGHGTAIRIWNQDPRWPALANSWMTSCVRSLQILAAIYEAVAAVALSRLNAGLIIAPSDQDQLPIPSASDVNGGQFPLGTDLQQRLYDEIGDHVEASAQEMDGWSRVVPAVVGVDSSIADKVSWVELARNMDPELRETIDNLRHRIYMASPLPPEVAEGMSEVSGLGGGNVAAQIDQSEYQRAILPVCERIAWANTQHVLRAGLLERNYTQLEVDRVQIGFSAKNLLMPPDRSDSAIKVAALPNPIPLLSADQLRDATGLGEFAGPDAEEARVHMILSLASGNPAYAYLLEEIGIPAPPAPSAAMPSEVIDVDEPPEIEAPEDDDEAEDEADDEARTTNRTPISSSLVVRQAAVSEDPVGIELVNIATRYEQDLAVLFGAIIDRMAERASSRVASLSRSKSWAEVRPVIRNLNSPMLGAVPAVRAQLQAEGVDDGDLFEPALAAFSDRFARLTTAAQRRAVRTAGADWAQLEDEANQSNLAAWALAGTLLIQEARYRFDGKLPDEGGEASVDPFGIPSGIIRRTSAVAGGDTDIAPGADPDRLSTSNLTTIATALLAREALRLAGRIVIGWVWDYRPEIVRNTYEEHFDMHEVFEPGEQPGSFEGWYPGDHRGCECITRPVTGLGQVGEGVTF